MPDVKITIYLITVNHGVMQCVKQDVITSTEQRITYYHKIDVAETFASSSRAITNHADIANVTAHCKMFSHRFLLNICNVA